MFQSVSRIRWLCFFPDLMYQYVLFSVTVFSDTRDILLSVITHHSASSELTFQKQTEEHEWLSWFCLRSRNEILTRALAHLWLFSAFMWYSMYFVSNTKTFNVIVLQFSASNVGNSVCIYIIVGVNHGEDARDVYPLRYWSWYSYDTRPRFWNFWHVM